MSVIGLGCLERKAAVTSSDMAEKAHLLPQEKHEFHWFDSVGPSMQTLRAESSGVQVV